MYYIARNYRSKFDAAGKAKMDCEAILEEIGWNKLNYRWAYFFIFLAVLNEVVWRTFAPEKEYIWVNFKVWGILPLTFIFTASQIPLINKHKI